eukprot:523246-Pelagomonas_calceolata.AAC.1
MLDKPTQLRKVKEEYDGIIATEEELQPCVLRCKGCRMLISAVHPTMTAKQHDSSCTRPPGADEMEELDGADVVDDG